MKKFLLGLLVLMFSFTLIACNKVSEDTTEDENTIEESSEDEDLDRRVGPQGK